MRTTSNFVSAAGFLLLLGVLPASADDGAAGPSISGDFAASINSSGPGEQAVVFSNGDPATAGGASQQGGAGGPINVTATSYVNNVTIGAISQGGGTNNSTTNGGAGGTVTWNEDTTTSSRDLVVASVGGYGSATSGSGGTVNATIAGTHVRPGENRPGYGGTVVASIGNNGGLEAGDGGTINVLLTGETSVLQVYSQGGSGTTNGNGGAVNVTLAGEVTYGVYVDSRPGTTANGGGTAGSVKVTLKNGADIGGDIVAGDASTAVLEFAFELANELERSAVRQELSTKSSASGTITINNRDYSWSGFTSLKESLKLLSDANPGSPIVVTINAGSDASASSPGDSFNAPNGIVTGRNNGSTAPFAKLFDLLKKPAGNAKILAPTQPTVVGKLRCDTRDVTVFRLSDGGLAINIRLEDGKAYAVGTIVDGVFKRAPGGRWTADMAGKAIAVSTRSGEIIATCTI